jgi:hypothetical protein
VKDCSHHVRWVFSISQLDGKVKAVQFNTVHTFCPWINFPRCFLKADLGFSPHMFGNYRSVAIYHFRICQIDILIFSCSIWISVKSQIYHDWSLNHDLWFPPGSHLVPTWFPPGSHCHSVPLPPAEFICSPTSVLVSNGNEWVRAWPGEGDFTVEARHGSTGSFPLHGIHGMCWTCRWTSKWLVMTG